MSSPISISQRPSVFLKCLTGLVFLTHCANSAHGQEALQLSLAGDLAAESQRQANNSIGYYNLLWGPVSWRFSSALEMNYNDNVNLSQNPQSDIILRPNLNTQMHWPLTQKNSLDISLGLGYSLYLNRSELDQMYVSPGSGLSFDVYVGDWVFNLHDRVSMTQSAYQNPTVGGNGNFAQLENTAGANASWDLNKMMLELGYDHNNTISIGGSQQVGNSSSENWFGDIGFVPIPELTVGIEGGYTLVSYEQSQSSQPGAAQLNAGLFCKAQISEYISGRLDAGYTVYMPNAGGTYTNLNDSAGMYFQFSVSHTVNRFFNYSLSAGRSTESSSFGQPYNYYFARFQPNWSIFRKYQFSTPCWWERGTQLANELYGQGGSTVYTQYGAGIEIGRAITQNFSTSLSYQMVRESSGQAKLNYTVNIISLNFSYQF